MTTKTAELFHCDGCSADDAPAVEPWVIGGMLAMLCPDCSEISEHGGAGGAAGMFSEEEHGHRLEIWKRWTGRPDQLERAKLQTTWFGTTSEEFIRHVQLAGIDKKTAFELLIAGEIVHTPWALYATGEFVEKDR